MAYVGMTLQESLDSGSHLAKLNPYYGVTLSFTLIVLDKSVPTPFLECMSTCPFVKMLIIETSNDLTASKTKKGPFPVERSTSIRSKSFIPLHHTSMSLPYIHQPTFSVTLCPLSLIPSPSLPVLPRPTLIPHPFPTMTITYWGGLGHK